MSKSPREQFNEVYEAFLAQEEQKITDSIPPNTSFDDANGYYNKLNVYEEEEVRNTAFDLWLEQKVPSETTLLQTSLKSVEKILHSLTHLTDDKEEMIKLKKRIKKADAASCATMKEAIECLNRMAGEFDPRIVTAVQLYMQPEWRTLQKVGKKIGVSKATVSKWFNFFEEETGFNLGRPKPGENFSVREQTETTHFDGNTHNRTRMIKPGTGDN